MSNHGMHPNSIANLKKGGAKTRFQPGVSGNPGGKPRCLYDIQAAARKKSPEAFKTIIKVMEDEKTAPSLKVKCAEIVLERAFGKATVAVDVDVEHKSPGVRILFDTPTFLKISPKKI